jgi:hypothetical protein
MAEQASADHPDAAPLNRMQREILLRQDLLGSPIYVIGNITWLEGPLRADLLDRAAQDVVEAEDMLRAWVRKEAGAPSWSIAPPIAWRTTIVQAGTIAVENPAVENPAVESPAVQDPAVESPAIENPAIENPAVESPSIDAGSPARTLAAQMRLEGIDPYAAPLWRFALLRLAPQRHAWITYFHHVLTDGFGIRLAWQRMRARYNQLLEAQDGAPAPPLERRAAVLAAEGAVEPQLMERNRQFWEERFAPPPRRGFPRIPAGVRQLLAHLVERRWIISWERWQRFEACAGALNVWPAQAMMALLAAHVARAAALEDIVLEVPLHERTKAAELESVGQHFRTMPLRLALGPKASFISLARDLAREFRLAFFHRQYPVAGLLGQQPPRGGIAGMPYDLTVSVETFDYDGNFGAARSRVEPCGGHPALSPVFAYVRLYRPNEDVAVDFVIDPRAAAPLLEEAFTGRALDELFDAAIENPEKTLMPSPLPQAGEGTV